MEATQAVAPTVVTSPSWVIVPRQDPLPKLVYGLVLLVLGVVFFIGLVLLLSALLPRARDAAREALQHSPWRALLLGLAGYAVLGSLAAFLFSNSYVEYLLRTEIVPGMLAAAFGVCAALGAITLLGATGTVAALGQRLEALNGRPVAGLRRTVLGSLTLVLASLFPAVGWFLVLPATLALSFGAAALGALRRLRRRA